MRVLVARPDRLGDVILSTPVLSALKKADPSTEISFLVKPEHIPVLEGLSTIDEFVPFDSRRQLREWVSVFKKDTYDVVIFLQNDHWKLALAAQIAGIPIRVGTAGKWFSYCFYTHPIRQNRSRVEKHEAEYGLELLEKVGIDLPKDLLRTEIFVSDEARAECKQWLDQQGVRKDQPLVVIHGGMGGSALNWPLSHYLDLATGLKREGVQVVFSIGPQDREFRQLIAESDLKKALIFEGRPVDQLAALYSNADVVVAPSTGPLHIAVALGRPTVSFYPPLRVQSSRRWGPYGMSPDQAVVLSPDVVCPKVFKCAEERCPNHPCMDTISVKTAQEKVHQMIGMKR